MKKKNREPVNPEKQVENQDEKRKKLLKQIGIAAAIILQEYLEHIRRDTA